MKKFFLAAVISAFSFFAFVSCIEPSLSEVDLYTAEELTAKMNEAFKEQNVMFELLDSKEFHKGNDYKIMRVELKASDMPEKIVKAYHHVGIDIENESIPTEARLTIPCVCSEIVTDYYNVKYEAEIKAYINNSMNELFEDFKNDYECKVVWNPRIKEVYSIYYNEYYSKSIDEIFSSARVYDVVILVNGEYDKTLKSYCEDYCRKIKKGDVKQKPSRLVVIAKKNINLQDYSNEYLFSIRNDYSKINEDFFVSAF